jgi:uncharacterized phage protein gp47/JayE
MAYGTIEIRTFETILQTMINVVVTRTELTDLLDASGFTQILVAAARSDETLYFQIAKVITIFNIDKATGQDLTLRALDFDLTRLGPRRAQGTVEFTRDGTSNTKVIPAGTRIAKGEQEYLTLQDATILDTQSISDVVSAIATVAGPESNANVNEVTTVVTAFSDPDLAGLSVTNVAPMQNGANEETDVELRDRIRAKTRSLNRTSPDALRAIALLVELDSGERVLTATVVESLVDFGRVDLFIDNGTGNTETFNTVGDAGATPGLGETLTSSATGGEFRFFLQNPPVRRDPSTDIPQFVLLHNAVALVLGVDYRLQSGTGFVVLDGTAFPTGLAPADSLEAHYTFWTGLVQQVQFEVDGRQSSLQVFPGGRAAGARVFVRVPEVLVPAITTTAVIADGFDGATVRAEILAAELEFVNSLPIGGDIILANLTDIAMEIAGVSDFIINNPIPDDPPNNIAVADNQIARMTAADFTVL